MQHTTLCWDFLRIIQINAFKIRHSVTESDFVWFLIKIWYSQFLQIEL